MSINIAFVCGHLGRDAELRTLTDGRSVATLSVATTERWKDKATGEDKEATEWHRVVVFGPAATFAGEAKKGDKVTAVGNLKTRKWTDQAGVERYSTEIVVSGFGTRFERMSAAGPASGAATTTSGSKQSRSSGGGAAKNASGSDFDDDIPF